MSAHVRLWLRADAAFDLCMGLLLLAASWTWLYETLELPVASAPVYAQVAGGLLLGYAVLLWTTEPPSHRMLAGVTAGVNVLGVIVVGAWLVSGELAAGTLGKIILWLAVVALAVFATAEIRIAREESG